MLLLLRSKGLFMFEKQRPAPLTALASYAAIGLATLIWLAPIWSGFDLLRQAWALVAGAALFAVLFAALVRRWKRFWISLAGLAAICVPVIPELWGSLNSQHYAPYPANSTLLSVGTHNLWGRNSEASNATATLVEMNADVLALQEAFGESGDVTTELRSHYAYEANCTRHSTRLLSNLEIIESGCMQDLLIASLPTQAEWWRHQFPPSTWARIRLRNGETAVVVAVHMTWPDPLSVQNEQRRNLAQQLQQFDQDRLIVLGDFNAASPSIALSRMERDFGLERRTFLLPTWPSQGIGQRFGFGDISVPTMFTGIDHVFAGEAWTTLSVERGPNTGSDHRPVMVRLGGWDRAAE
jgi:endonuclease/exonuclease/phosphatase (EEP) superfamily protein YafD